MPNRDQADPADAPTVIAVDAGGTSTRAGWFTADGRCLGFGRAAGGNPISRGIDFAIAQLALAVSRAAEAEGRFRVDRQPRWAVVALAGGSLGNEALMAAALADVGFEGELMLASDLLAGYLSGAREQAGYGLIAGTGAAAIRVADGVDVAVADGVGWLLGDRGSGFWIGLRAVQATMRWLDGRTLPPLAVAVLAEAGIVLADISEAGRNYARHPAVIPLVQASYGATPVDLAKFAPVTIRLAAAGDQQALDIIRGAVAELISTLESVVEPTAPGPIVVNGGVASVLPGLAEALTQLQRAHGWVPDIRVSGDGLLGAAVLALRAAGVTVSDMVFAELRAGLAERVESA